MQVWARNPEFIELSRQRSEIELILLMRLPDGIKTDLTNQIQ